MCAIYVDIAQQKCFSHHLECSYHQGTTKHKEPSLNETGLALLRERRRQLSQLQKHIQPRNRKGKT